MTFCPISFKTRQHIIEKNFNLTNCVCKLCGIYRKCPHCGWFVADCDKTCKVFRILGLDWK